MGKRTLYHVPLGMCDFGGPLIERRAEAVNRRDLWRRPMLQKLRHRHIRERLPSRASEQIWPPSPFSGDLKRSIAQRDSVLLTSLHSFGRNRPNLRLEV